MECNEVFSVSSSISLLRARRRKDSQGLSRAPGCGPPPPGQQASAGPDRQDSTSNHVHHQTETVSVPAILSPTETRGDGGIKLRLDKLADFVAYKVPLKGRKEGSNVIDDEVDIGFEGVKISSFVGDDNPSSPPAIGSARMTSYTNLDDLRRSITADTDDVTESETKRRWYYLCHCRRDLLAVKVFYFAFIGGIGVVLPYTAVFLKQLGLSAFQIGVISGIRPALGFISGPLWGSIADRFRIRRVLMMISVLAWLAFYVGFYFTQAPDRLSTCPDGGGPLSGPAAVSGQGDFHNITTLNITDSLGFKVPITSPSDYDIFTTDSPESTYISNRNNSPVTIEPISRTSLTTSTSYSSENINERNRRMVDGSPTPGDESPTTDSPEQVTPAEDFNATTEARRENLSWLYEEVGLHRVFLTCVLIICGGELFQAPTTALSDAATLQVLGREGLDQYGAQRAWGPIGWAISSLAAGALLSSNRVVERICGIDIAFSDYRVLAFVFIAIMVFAIGAALKIDFSTPEDNKLYSAQSSVLGEPVKKQHSLVAVLKFFLNVHYGSWIVTTFFVGVCNGIIWGFLFWHLDNLGGSQLLMGVDSVVACVCEFFAFFIVEHVIKYVGHIGIMYIGLVGYIIRFIIYASIVNPWWVLPAEALQGVTFSFIWVSLTSYTAIGVPDVSLATIQGIIHGVYFGLGNGLGHLFGGITIGLYGAVMTFYAMAVICTVWLLIFIACQKLSRKPINQFAYQDMEKDADADSSHRAS